MVTPLYQTTYIVFPLYERRPLEGFLIFFILYVGRVALGILLAKMV